ncbi:MAG: gas vesicle protein [Neobacillus sp.]|nr:gas vesicle protein [Neobacillus sp.]
MPIHHPPQSSNLLDVLEKILDKGVVIAGDIKISLADVDLLTIKIRLLVASVDKAREIGMDWWEKDPYYSSRGKIAEQEHSHLIDRINRLEQVIEKNALPLPIESEAFPIPSDESSSSSFQTEESSSNHHLPDKPKKKEK